jgi:hypothetical protein
MNLIIKKSPILNPNFKSKNFGDLLGGTVLFEEGYNKNRLTLSETLTTSYQSDYLNILCFEAFQKYQFTDFQKKTFTSFFDIFEDISRTIHPKELNIKIVQSKDAEICIYRKSKEGISMIAIDEDGDGFYNFTGYKNEEDPVFFDSSEHIDFEALTYQFLSK